MILNTAFSEQSNHLHLLRKLFKFSMIGFTSSFPVGRKAALPAVTLEYNLVKQGESTVQDLR